MSMRRRLSAALGLVLLAASAGCTLPGARQTVTAWLVGGDEELTFDSPPSLENEFYSASRGQLHLKAALNETVAIQLALRAGTLPAGPLDVRTSDLSGPGGVLPSDSVFTVYRVHYVQVENLRSWYTQRTGRPASPTLFPDILVPWEAPRGGGPVRLTEPRNELVWLDLRVPATTAPGPYRGRLEVHRTTDSRPVLACDIHLEVLPVALPGPTSLPVICRVDPRDLLAEHLRWPILPAEETRLLPQTPSHLAALRLVGQTMLLFHEHRTLPILWASFPKYRLLGERTLEVEWDDYDRLVAGWLDGTAFPDRVRLELWPLPVSLEYPSADRNGGVGSPEYASLLTAYLLECQRHFAQRGWLDRAFLRLCPPQPLSAGTVERVRRLGELLRQADIQPPLVAHLPARSLQGLGWYNAPPTEQLEVGIWCPPARWYEPSAMRQAQQAGGRSWFMPDNPPYGGSLAVESPPIDVCILPWQAYRYESQAIWVERAAELRPVVSDRSERAFCSESGLIYAGEPYGLHDRPVPSIRLKRLRRGLEDYELLKLLEENGKPLLARRLAEQLVRWAGTDACLENLLSCKPTGWPRSASELRLARLLMLQELAGQFEPDPSLRQRQIESLSQWGRMMSQVERVCPMVEGVRLTLQETGLRAEVLVSIENTSDRPLQGRWSLPALPPGWQLAGEVPVNVEPGARRPARLEVLLPGLAYNADGVHPLELAFDSPTTGTLRVPARLAVAVCPPLEKPPVIDGRLEDWPLSVNNAAGDFRVCRFDPPDQPEQDRPALPTQAFFGLDRECLYVGLRCWLQPGQGPQWQADNLIPVEGATPWGQDVVEILLDPRDTHSGTSSDLYCLQVKPTGLLVARKGCRTEPPMGNSEPWQSGARVAVAVGPDAWVAELAVPLASFGPQARLNRVWGCNLTRLDARRGEYSSWAKVHGYAYCPQLLGNLIMLWR